MRLDFLRRSSAAPASPTLQPQPPLAKRLNRNALTVAAVVMGMTVLTAIVLLEPGRDHGASGAARATSEATPPVPTRPTFLDRPVKAPSDTPPSPARSLGSDVPLPQASHIAAAGQPSSVIEGPMEDQVPSGEASVQPTLSPRYRAFQDAIASPVLAGGARDTPGASSTKPASVTEQESALLSASDSIMRAASQATATAPASTPTYQSVVEQGYAQDPHRAFLDAAGDSRGSTVVTRLEPAGSPYMLRAGTVIPGVLITAINSDLPGEIVGQVSRDVYDSRTQRLLIIPKGSRLIGSYENRVAAGQGRLLVAWTRLILPDGRSMHLPGLALKDPQGQTGAKGDVDNHWRRVFGSALLLSAISAGVQLSQPQQSSVFSPPSAGQVAGGAVGQELSSVALDIIRRGMDVPPTVTVRQGQPFDVFLNGDLVFDGPYEEAAVSQNR